MDDCLAAGNRRQNVELRFRNGSLSVYVLLWPLTARVYPGAMFSRDLGVPAQVYRQVFWCAWPGPGIRPPDPQIAPDRASVALVLDLASSSPGLTYCRIQNPRLIKPSRFTRDLGVGTKAFPGPSSPGAMLTRGEGLSGPGIIRALGAHESQVFVGPGCPWK